MLYLTCTTITSVDLAHYGVSRAKDWVSVDFGTISCYLIIDPVAKWVKHWRSRVRAPLETKSSQPSTGFIAHIINLLLSYMTEILLKRT